MIYNGDQNATLFVLFVHAYVYMTVYVHCLLPFPPRRRPLAAAVGSGAARAVRARRGGTAGPRAGMGMGWGMNPVCI